MEISEAERKQRNLLEWNDFLSDQSPFKTYEELLENIAGEYRVHYKSTYGVFRLSRGEGKPFQVIDFSYHCFKLYMIPVITELIQGETTWRNDMDLLVMVGDSGLVMDKEAPPPAVRNPLINIIEFEHVDDIPSFGAESELPGLNDGEKRNHLYAKILVFTDGKVELIFMTEDIGETEYGWAYMNDKKWFELEGERIDPD